MRINLNVRPQLRYLVQRKWSIMLDNCTTNRRKKFELFSQNFTSYILDAIALQKEREERVRRVREHQEEERKKKLEELRAHVSIGTRFPHLWKF